MEWVEILKKYYPLFILAIAVIISFIYIKLKNKKKTEQAQQPPLYEPIVQPNTQPEPVFNYEEPEPKQEEFSLEDNANNVLDYIQHFTEQLNKELDKTSKNMEKEVSSIDKVDNKVNKIMGSLKKHRENLNKQKNVLRMNINAIENAKTALTSPQQNPICSICRNELSAVGGGYNCPMHGFIPFN